MRKFCLFLIGFLTTSFLIACAPQQEQAVTETAAEFPVLTGPYLGQVPPGDEPKLFAPGIVTSGLSTRDIAMMPDGSEIYFGLFLINYKFSAIAYSKLENGRWTKPEIAPFSGRYKDLEPCISRDGKKFYFVSDRPKEEGGSAGNEDIWVADRADNGWSEPYNIGPPINTDSGEYFPSLTGDGTLYFTREDPQTHTNSIFRSRLVDGKYSEPEKLGPEINCGQDRFNAFIAPDESFCIVPAYGMPDSVGSVDYYIVFHNADGSWSKPINMGDKINTPDAQEYSASVSRDGKYLFFMSSRSRFDKGIPEKPLTLAEILAIHNAPEHGNSSIYWIDASFIGKLRPQ
jgi:hypothetical protein